jgi:hypothetical protein
LLTYLRFLCTSFQVQYQSDQFLDKNKDYVVVEHQNLLSSSSCSFVAGLFPSLSDEMAKSSKFSSIGARFKVSFAYHLLYNCGGLTSVNYCNWKVIIYEVMRYVNNSINAILLGKGQTLCSDLIGAATVAAIDGNTKFHRAPLH